MRPLPRGCCTTRHPQNRAYFSAGLRAFLAIWHNLAAFVIFISWFLETVMLWLPPRDKSTRAFAIGCGSCQPHRLSLSSVLDTRRLVTRYSSLIIAWAFMLSLIGADVVPISSAPKFARYLAVWRGMRISWRRSQVLRRARVARSRHPPAHRLAPMSGRVRQ